MKVLFQLLLTTIPVILGKVNIMSERGGLRTIHQRFKFVAARAEIYFRHHFFSRTDNLKQQAMCMQKKHTCIDAEINMFDTANLDSKGGSKKVLGSSIQKRREV